MTIVIVYNPELPEPWRVLVGKIVYKCLNLAAALRTVQEAATEKELSKLCDAR